MRTPRWQRIAARIVLVTFTTCFVGCGGSEVQAPTPTTSTMAEVPATLPPAPTPPTQPAEPPPTLPAQPIDQLSNDELRDLVGPVALYPDVVLASLLPATLHPDQIRDAAQYVGDAQVVERLPDDRGWDGSVVGLLQFPDVVRWLDRNPAWTDEMGQAVTYQQGDVLDAIQDYRRSVRDAGNLKSNQYQTVRPARNDDIYIEPARPDVVYVPSYDPMVATQPQPAQPSPGINPWLVFGGGAVVGALGAWALYSIFDDDDRHVTNNYYYGRGGGRRRIRSYDNYYYARSRRPQYRDWTPRQEARRARVQGWQRPQRLEHRARTHQTGRAAAPLRAPMKTTTTPAPRPKDMRREQRQERQQHKQENRQERQMQRQEHKQEQRGQKQQRQQQQRQNRQEQQQKQQEQRHQRQEQRQDRQQHQQQQRMQQQEQRQQQPPQRQQQQQQRQQRQQEQREQRQERQTERQEQRQERQQQNQNGKKKKPQAQ